MQIAINCRSILLNNRTGIGRYTYNLIDHLGQMDTQNQYILHAPKSLFDSKRHLPLFPYKNFKRYIDYFDRGVGNADLYHLPSPGPLPKRKQKKLVVTVHDLIYKAYPQGHTQETIDLTENAMQTIVKAADMIVCTSENTRNDLHRFFDFPKEKSVAILSGVDHRTFYRLADNQETQTLLGRFKAEPGFILFVGTIEPRKNLHTVIEALALLKKQNKLVHKLVVVGMRGWMTEQIMPLVMQKGMVNDVIFTGFLTDAEVNMLYNTCGVFVFPSFYEGFGFPIVEAFNAGAAVITSNTSSCAEIAFDAAITIDPSDAEKMAAAIQNVLEDKNVCNQLRAKGFERAKLFSVNAMVQNTLNLYKGLGS